MATRRKSDESFILNNPPSYSTQLAYFAKEEELVRRLLNNVRDYYRDRVVILEHIERKPDHIMNIVTVTGDTEDVTKNAYDYLLGLLEAGSTREA